MKRRILFVAATLAVAALSGGIVAWGVMHARPQTVSLQSAGPSADVFASAAGNHFTAYQPDKYPDLTYAAENAVRAVVNIEKTEQVDDPRYGGRAYRDPFFEFFGIPQGYSGTPQPREVRSGGSGVIISPDGFIVTNNHVVENASKLRVRLNDGRTFEARIVGTDPATDVALVRIDGQENLPTLPFGNSDDLRLGEWVLAIGSPFDLQSTITAGIVSAKARKLDVIPSQFRVESFIQTDAAVNPGNSGGALVNTRGELVGINTVIKSQTGSYIGYSFAVPESIVRKVVVDLKEYGVVQRAMLGITYREIDETFIDQLGEEYGITLPGGVWVAEVLPDGAAAAAGIRKGDVILSVDNVTLDRTANLGEQIAKHRPNDKVRLSIKRDGKVKQIEVVLRNRAGKAELIGKEDIDALEALGARFTEVSDKARRELRIDGGLRVTDIRDGGLLSKARVREGFIITHINGRSVRRVSDLQRIDGRIETVEGVYPGGQAVSYSFVR